MSKKRLLKLREKLNRKRPRFLRLEYGRYKRLGKKWRFPSGIDNKIRHKKKGKPRLVSVGFRNPRAVRGLHPSGFELVHVFNPMDLEKVDSENQVAVIGRTVGARKRIQIIDRAQELGVYIVNPITRLRESLEAPIEEEYEPLGEDYEVPLDEGEDAEEYALEDEEEEAPKPEQEEAKE